MGTIRISLGSQHLWYMVCFQYNNKAAGGSPQFDRGCSQKAWGWMGYYQKAYLHTAVISYNCLMCGERHVSEADAGWRALGEAEAVNQGKTENMKKDFEQRF